MSDRFKILKLNWNESRTRYNQRELKEIDGNLTSIDGEYFGQGNHKIE